MNKDANRIAQEISYWTRTMEKAALEEERAGDILKHLRAAKKVIDGELASPHVNGKPKVERGEQGFKPKYDRSSKLLILDLLTERKSKRGLTLREIAGHLQERGTGFSEQAVSYSLKKLVGEKKLLKRPSPKGVRGRYVYKINAVHALTEDQILEEHQNILTMETRG